MYVIYVLYEVLFSSIDQSFSSEIFLDDYEIGGFSPWYKK